jgi:CheY-like chemotaxis protein
MSSKPKILLIDDHKTVLKLIEAIIRLKGYDLIYAENGHQGISSARQEKPDLILLDVMMPDLDGFKVCQYLKSEPETKDIPVIFLTARGAEDDLEFGRKAGADGFISKPFQTMDVLKQVEQMLAGRQD